VKTTASGIPGLNTVGLGRTRDRSRTPPPHASNGCQRSRITVEHPNRLAIVTSVVALSPLHVRRFARSRRIPGIFSAVVSTVGTTRRGELSLLGSTRNLEGTAERLASLDPSPPRAEAQKQVQREVRVSVTALEARAELASLAE